MTIAKSRKSKGSGVPGGNSMKQKWRRAIPKNEPRGIRPRANNVQRSPGKIKLCTETLRQVDECSLSDMRPGDMILLDAAPLLKSEVETGFFAVLACPACGTLGLITPLQYSGNDPVICCSDQCSCRFRVIDKSRLHFLPIN
jgi:hypothetical protein